MVASAVGGIPMQIIHKFTGMLSHSIEGTAFQIRFLLSNPDVAQRLGKQGHEHVKNNFLITNNLRNYISLFLALSRKVEPLFPRRHLSYSKSICYCVVLVPRGDRSPRREPPPSSPPFVKGSLQFFFPEGIMHKLRFENLFQGEL